MVERGGLCQPQSGSIRPARVGEARNLSHKDLPFAATSSARTGIEAVASGLQIQSKVVLGWSAEASTPSVDLTRI